MANKNLFQTVRGLFTPKADTINEAGGTAYKLSPKQALRNMLRQVVFPDVLCGRERAAR
jgi:hypothetical protein